MASENLVVEIVQFTANELCLTNPSAFQAVRDIAQGWK
jgi:hypothetical protein